MFPIFILRCYYLYIMLIDTHAHLNFRAFDKDRDEVVKRSLDNNVWMINVGSNYQTSKKAVDLAEKYEKGVYPHTKRALRFAQKKEIGARCGVGVYAAIGLHPINLDTGLLKMKIDPAEGSRFEKDFDYQKYKNLATSKKVVAIGEIGLDYWSKPKTKTKLALFKEKQREVFLRELELAKELNLPVIFHCRKAHEDLLKLLKPQTGVIHCFTGDWGQAQKYLDMGLYLGFNGIIFKLDLDEIIKKTPLERILIETDCPYLIPPEAEGRNEPLYVKYIAQRIAQLKNETFEKIAEITFQNSTKLFNIVS